MTSNPQELARTLRSDARDLQRGVSLNLVGYVVKAANPLVFFYVIHLYGAEAFGHFAVAQATLLLVMRVLMLGLDQGLLWWIPRQREGVSATVSGAIVVVSLLSCVAMAVFFFSGRWLLVLTDGDVASYERLQWMTVALLPMSVSEILVHALLAARKVGAKVIVKDGLFPLFNSGLAIVLFLVGWQSYGLELAFFSAHSLSALVIYVFYRREFVKTSTGGGFCWPSKILVLHSIPLSFAQLLSTLLQRADLYLLALYQPVKVVGVYAATVQIANVIRSIRQSFDPLVVSIASESAAHRQSERLKETFSRATSAVLGLQLPIALGAVVGAPWIMALLGKDFSGGELALGILCCTWVLQGVLGFHGHVIWGLGYSKLQMFNALIAVALLLLSGFCLVPLWGMEGAALATAIAYLGQSLVQWVEGYKLSGVWLYNAHVLARIRLALMALLVFGLLWVSTGTFSSAWQRIFSFSGFLLVWGVGLFLAWRQARRASV